MANLLPFPGRAEDNEALFASRNADGTIIYLERTANGITLRQTWTYVGGFVTAVTVWVKQ